MQTCSGSVTHSYSEYFRERVVLGFYLHAISPVRELSWDVMPILAAFSIIMITTNLIPMMYLRIGRNICETQFPLIGMSDHFAVHWWI